MHSTAKSGSLASAARPGSPENLMIPSSVAGLRISVSVFSPPSPPRVPKPDEVPPTQQRPPPVIVMGHGIGVVKEAGLPPFASAFAAAGYMAVTFDYLHFGQSDGTPRNTLRVSRELQDFRDVVAWVRTQPDRFDASRIVVWASSFGGMHTTALLAEDHDLAGGVAQCPCIDGLAAALMVPVGRLLRLFGLAASDYLLDCIPWRRRPRKPIYLALSGDSRPAPGEPPALLAGPEAVHGWARMTGKDLAVPFPNRITARSVLSIVANRPVRRVHKSTKPYLFVLPAWDNQAPLPSAERAARLAPGAEVLRVPGGHFDLYAGGQGFRPSLDGQLDFLRRLLS